MQDNGRGGSRSWSAVVRRCILVVRTRSKPVTVGLSGGDDSEWLGVTMGLLHRKTLLVGRSGGRWRGIGGGGAASGMLERFELGDGLAELASEVGFVADDVIELGALGQDALAAEVGELTGEWAIGGALGVDGFAGALEGGGGELLGGDLDRVSDDSTVVATLRAVAHGERGGAGQAPSAESPFTIWMNRSSPFVPPFTAIRTPRHSPARARSAQFIRGAGAASQRIRWSVK